jgi:hypothetical protein
MDPTWMLQSFVDQNPLVWMAEVNGLLADLRDMPREVQQIAYEKGMIPISRQIRNNSGGSGHHPIHSRGGFPPNPMGDPPALPGRQ